MSTEKTLDKLQEAVEILAKKIEKKTIDKRPIPKKNSHIHIMINTEEKRKLMNKAKEEGIPFAEWCRKKLRGSEQLNRIEKKIDRILHENANS